MSFKPPPEPEGCVDVVEHERRLTASADALEARGLALIADTDRIRVASGNQLLVSAIKARSTASQLAAHRLDKAFSEWLINEDKKRRGTEAPRPALKRRKTTP